MQKHKHVHIDQNAISDTNAELREEFEAVVAKPVIATRVVKLKYKSCCGCGCNTQHYKREVPYDSPLKDGDFIDYPEDTDERVR